MEEEGRTVYQTRVHVGEEHGGILEEDLDRFPQRLNRDLSEAQVSLVNFSLRLEIRIAREFAQSLSSTKKDIVRISLRHRHEHHDEDGRSSPKHLPERPSPAFDDDAESGEQRAESGSAECCGNPGCQTVGKFEKTVLRIDVLEDVRNEVICNVRVQAAISNM